MKNRSYSELYKLKTFEERFNYLKLNGSVGEDIFGHARYLNQKFYHSKEWLDIRRDIIIRDNGCDLGVEGHDIYDKIIIHHMEPGTVEDLINFNPKKLLNPDNLICVSQKTHQAIHYGDISLLSMNLTERKPGDTKLW